MDFPVTVSNLCSAKHQHLADRRQVDHPMPLPIADGIKNILAGNFPGVVVEVVSVKKCVPVEKDAVQIGIVSEGRNPDKLIKAGDFGPFVTGKLSQVSVL
jgi:hypothetical protein